jgi:UDP-N-acetyl-2-amino-2-deoxyglucuronate dehydrogenase
MTMQIGLIGGGNISCTHARAVSAISGAKVTAVFGTNAEKVTRICKEHGGRPYQNFQEFLSHRPMDMVVIGSPSGLHAAQGIEAARHGLHVLVEKPIDISSERADALIAKCKEAQVKLGVIFQDRFQLDIRRLKQMISDGVVGRPLLADARVKWFRPSEYYAGSRWRGTWALDGGGALINQGVHTVDLLLYLLGDVLQVQARTATLLQKIETEDTAVALLDFANGALGVLQATTAAYPGYRRRVEITGSEGTVILEHDRIIAADLKGQAGDWVTTHEGDRNVNASSPVVSDFRGHQSAIEDFIHAVEEDGTPECDGEAGRRSVALVEAIYRASRSPQSLPLSPSVRG